MYIKKIEVTNFKSFIDYNRFDFSKNGNLIFGENGKGKSSLSSLITFALYGIDINGSDRIDYLMSVNEETKELIANTTECTATIVLDDDTEHTIHRIKTIKGTTIRYDDEEILQSALTKILGNEKLFLMIFTGEYFVDASESDRRKLLNTFLPTINKQEVLMELIDEKIFKKYEIDLANDELLRFKNLKSKLEKQLVVNDVEVKNLYDILNSENINNDSNFNSERFDELKEKLSKVQEDIKYNEKIKQNLENIKKQKEFNNSIIEKNNIKQIEKDNLEKTLSELKSNEIQKPTNEQLNLNQNDLNKNEILYLEIKEKIENISKIKNKCPICDNDLSGDKLNSLLNIYIEKQKEIEKNILEIKEKINNEKQDYENLLKNYENYKNKILDTENKIKNITFNEPVKIENVENELKSIPDIKDEISEFKNLQDIRDEYIKQQERIKVQKEEKEKAQVLINEKREENKKIKNKLKEVQKIYDAINKILPSEILKRQTKILKDNLKNTEIVLFKKVKTTNELKDCCNVFFKGKPYNSISRSEKIFCCHEISEMFTKLSEKTYPIFIDNSECIADINRLIKKNYYKQFFITKVEKNVDLIIKHI